MNNSEIANLRLLAAQVDGHSEAEIAKQEYLAHVEKRQFFVSKIKPIKRIVRSNAAYPDNVTKLPEVMTEEEEIARDMQENFEQDRAEE